MLRPLPPHLADALESDDSAPFGGLADVLEPDLDRDPDPDAVTSMRHLDAASVRSLRSLASHKARASTPLSVRAPAQIEDFAFADTVFAKELPGDEPPDSGPIFVNDAMGNTQCVTPLAFPLPPASDAVDLPTRMRVLLAHVRHGARRSREEMRELWASTAEVTGGDGSVRAAPFLHRVLVLWSCFQWSRADLVRAAMIGLAVFVTAAALGAATMDRGAASGSSTEVRATRTLEQHTSRKIAVHGKR